MFAIIRRTRAGKPIMAADRQHLHHRLLNIGHSYRQSVLIMYLWAALFSGAVVSLSIVRTPSVVFFAATLVAVLALLPATMPSLRPWSTAARKKAPAGTRTPAGTRIPAGNRAAPATVVPTAQAAAAAVGASLNGATPTGPGTEPGHTRNESPFPGNSRPGNASSSPGDPLPRAGRLPAAAPFPGPGPFAAQDPFPAQESFPGQEPFPAQDPFSARDHFASQEPFRNQDWRPAQVPFTGADPSPFPDPSRFPDPSPFPGTAPFAESPAEPGDDLADGRDPFPQAHGPDARPR
jgi:hypothetical protein